MKTALETKQMDIFVDGEYSVANDWQICPICNGTKKQPFFYDENGILLHLPAPCQTCNQTGIISKQTGKPPKP